MVNAKEVTGLESRWSNLSTSEEMRVGAMLSNKKVNEVSTSFTTL
jgi:hypothetical protein